MDKKQQDICVPTFHYYLTKMRVDCMSCMYDDASICLFVINTRVFSINGVCLGIVRAWEDDLQQLLYSSRARMHFLTSFQATETLLNLTCSHLEP